MLRTQQIQLYKVPTVHLHIFKRLFLSEERRGPEDADSFSCVRRLAVVRVYIAK